MSVVEGFVLTGGQSRRMGADKAHLVLEGQTFQDRIANELSAVTDSVATVGGGASEAAPSQTSLRRIPDVYPGWGALGGVHAALSNCSAEWALVVACDFPFVTRALFSRLIELREDADAVTPIQSDQIPQPLCSLYRVSTCLKRADELIKSGERKPIALLQSVRTRWVRFDEVADLENASHFFDNINSPQDYERIIETS